MTNLADSIAARGGLAPTHQLLAHGFTKYDLRRAMTSGRIIRVRQGWYALPDVDSARLAAVRVGGRLTCSVGAQTWGLWTRLASPPLHIAVPRNGSRLRDATDHRIRRPLHGGPVVHWTGQRGGRAFVEDPIACLVAMSHCEPPESVVAAVDCALGLELITRGRWRCEPARMPARLALLLSDVDGRSGSYWESVLRFRLHRLGIAMQVQVEFARDLRVDLLIGRHLVVEVDGMQHDEPGQHQVDRNRDARLSILGCRCLRFTPRQIRSEWPSVRAAILSAIARGDAD